jgi:hypothetical protein
MRNRRWLRLLAYMTGSVNQELLVRNEYIASRRESNFEGEIAVASAAFQPRTGHPGRDRKAPGAQSAPRSCLRRETRHDPGLVSKVDRREVRRLQTPAVSGPTANFIRSRSFGGPDGAGELRLGL